MSTVARYRAAILLLFLQGCGGGGETQIGVRSLGPDGQKAALTAAGESQAVPDADTLFNWAEWKFPEFFGERAQTVALTYEGSSYRVRGYANGNYVGLRSDGGVYGLGPYTGNVLQRFGSISEFAVQVNSEVCYFKPGACPELMSAGRGHVVAIRRDGSVVAWGDNRVGQLGEGPIIPGSRARVVLTSAKQVVAGETESLALRPDGSVVGWGRKYANHSIIGGVADATVFADSRGLMEFEEGTRVPHPVPVAFPPGVQHLTVSGTSSYALMPGRTVAYLPGTGIATPQGVNVVPNVAPEFNDVTRVHGTYHDEVLITRSNGTIWTFLRLGFALPGAQIRIDSYKIDGLAGVIDFGCLVDRFVGRECAAVLADGSVWQFDRYRREDPPIKFDGLPRIVEIAKASGYFALTESGEVWQWGDIFNQGVDARVPRKIPGLTNVVGVTSTRESVFFRKADGTVWGMGANRFGELGNGNTNAVEVPTQIAGILLN